MFLIVGLGNPGAQYERTRHNVGFLVIEELARRAGAQVKREECRAVIGRAEIAGAICELVKPQTFMNLSGEAVACLLRKREIDVQSELLVVTDDLALPFGKTRLRERGSSGGHNGLKSLIANLRTEDFMRLRVGIRPEHEISDTKNFVLATFPASLQTELDQVIERCADLIESIVRNGASQTMAQYN